MQTVGSILGGFRALLFATALLVFVGVVVAANVGLWSTRIVLDEDAFIATADATLDDPAVRGYVATEIADRVFSLLIGADGRIPAGAAAAIGVDEEAARDEVVPILDGLIESALGDPRVIVIRDAALRALHRTVASTAAGEGPLSIEGDSLILDLDALIDQLPVSVTAAIPGGPTNGVGSIVILQSSTFSLVTSAIGLLDVAVWLLPLLAGVVALLVLLLARHRVHALFWLGAAAAVASLICIAVVAFGGVFVTADLAEGPGRDAARGLYAGLLDPLWIQSLVLLGAAIVLMAIGVAFGTRDPRGKQMAFG